MDKLAGSWPTTLFHPPPSPKLSTQCVMSASPAIHLPTQPPHTTKPSIQLYKMSVPVSLATLSSVMRIPVENLKSEKEKSIFQVRNEAHTYNPSM